MRTTIQYIGFVFLGFFNTSGGRVLCRLPAQHVSLQCPDLSLTTSTRLYYSGCAVAENSTYM